MTRYALLIAAGLILPSPAFAASYCGTIGEDPVTFDGDYYDAGIWGCHLTKVNEATYKAACEFKDGSGDEVTTVRVTYAGDLVTLVWNGVTDTLKRCEA